MESFKNILISDEVDDKCVQILKENGFSVTKNTKLTKDQLLQEIPAYDGLIVRSATTVTSAVIEAGKRLRVIGRAGTGVDNIDLDAATQHGIVVMNTPGGNTMSAAELTCTMILATSRNIAQGSLTLKQGQWARKQLMGQEVYGKTLGIVGLGRIGREVALRMQAFGMTTIGFDPIIPAEVSAEFNTEWMTLEKLWPLCDYITVHTPLIPQTKDLINTEVLNKCKKGVRIINCARGGIVSEEALLQALESGQCGGAGLDVFVQEPPTNSPIIQHPKVTCTPHLGASTAEAQSRVAVEIAEQFVELSQGKGLTGAVNANALSKTMSGECSHLLTLARALGLVLSCVMDDKLDNSKITVGAADSVRKQFGDALIGGVLTGVFSRSSTNNLNLVSAPFYAKKHNVKVELVNLDAAKNPDVLKIQLISEGRNQVELVGGANKQGPPTLLSMNQFKFSGTGPALEGNFIMFNSDGSGTSLQALIGALASSGRCVQSLHSCQASEGQSTTVMHTTPAVADAKALAEFAKNIKIVSL